MGFKYGNPYGHYIPSELLDDLCSRFIINLPPGERWNLVRVCFHIELAHWFYLDNYCEIYKLRPCGLKTFATHIFQHIPDLRKHVSNLDIVLKNWREYQHSIPTYGAILLDEDLSHVLLVQSYNAKKSWGFPKGKIHEGEEPWNCAAREVLEETGFDISKLINKREYMYATVNGITICLYIIANVPRDTNFKPRTRNEIRACAWFPIDGLPSNKDMKLNVNMSVKHKKFTTVKPFLKKIWRWVSERNINEQMKRTRCTRQKSMSSIEWSTIKTKKEISQERHNDFTPYQYLPDQELQVAYMKYLQCNQPTQKLLNMIMKNQLPYKYQHRQLYQVQNCSMTNNVWTTNTIENNLSNIKKYYQQDLPTQQLKNALMIYEQQGSPYYEYQESQLY